MHYEQQLGYRYPKGRFALISVYSFTGAAILASTIFSLLLFLSIDDNPLMQALFGGLASFSRLESFTLGTSLVSDVRTAIILEPSLRLSFIWY